MRKVLSFVLMICMLLQIPANMSTVHAVEGNRLQEEQGENDQYTEEGISVTVSSGDMQDVPATVSGGDIVSSESSIEVQINSMMAIKSSFEMSVVLKDLEKGTTQSELLLFDESETGTETALFDGLEDGEYQIEVSAPGFETYRQSFSVEGMNYKIQLLTDYSPGFDFSGRHPGVIRIGDADGNGSIDEKDKTVLLDMLQDPALAEGSYADFNGDGVLNLLDLQYFAWNYDRIEDRTATVQTSIPTGQMSANAPVNTVVTGGSIEEVLTGGTDSSVTLQPADNAAISADNPVEVEILLTKDEEETLPVSGITIASPLAGENAVTEGDVVLEYVEDGITKEMRIPLGNTMRSRSAGPVVTREADGSFVIDLAGQIAVKKVTIVITGSQSNKLAEISKVEFLNDMENRIPAPSLDIPQNLYAEPGNKMFDLYWDKAQNVTGYEVWITDGVHTEIISTSNNELKVSSLAKEKLVNGTAYQVKVQSVNGDWRSGYCEAIAVVPKPGSRPDKPDNLKAEGKYRSITVSWKDMEDTDFYNVYYKEETQDAYVSIPNVMNNSIQIDNLKDNTKYLVYVTGVNELGESDPSLVSAAVTANVMPARLPEYKRLNTSNGTGVLTSHIVDAKHLRSGSIMVDSPLDEGDTTSALGTVDDSYASYYYMGDWDDGAAYGGSSKGIQVSLDQEYKIKYITFAEHVDGDAYGRAAVYYKDSSTGKEIAATDVSITRKSDGTGRYYYLVKLGEPVTTDTIRLCIGRTYSSNRNIYIAEIGLYYYDSLEDDIMGLYEDDLHLVLKSDVSREDVQALQERLDSIDETSGEYHFERELLQRELDNARQILEQENLANVVEIHPQITAQRDRHLGFGGLNAWQPAGVSARAGETLVVYVGHPTKKTGEATNLQLVATQYHAEASAFAGKPVDLKVGRNEITIPKIQSLDVEAGGSVYIQYTGNNNNDRYGVRVSGGQQIPVLDLYQKDRSEWPSLVTEYVRELEGQRQQLEAMHNEVHLGQDNTDYQYDQVNCILGATEIMLDQMMYSVSGQQLLAGVERAGAQTTEQKAQRLTDSLIAMDDMMTLFYHQKGLTEDTAAGGKNLLPAQHQNIRYHRMFAKAFMYAGGNHIGIEWGSVPGLATSVPVVSDNGKYQSGNYFGWGIAHEIGHCINQGTYAVAEVTNNYFSVLAQAKETNDSVRFSYDKVYDKVTSGVKGRDANVFTQLGLYWQLHLAYDRGYNYKIYDTYQEQFDNLFFARVDTYARDASKAPAPGGIALDITSGDTDQKLMRLSCAAAQKNLLEFFGRWGMTPDETTIAYASQFEEETRAIYYVSDEARAYEIENSASMEGLTVKGKDVVGEVSARIDEVTSNQVNFALSHTAEVSDAVLGYEISRYSISDGKESKTVVGFTTENEFSDVVTTINNRVMIYEVVVIDKFLNRSEPKRLEPLKVSHDGSYGKEQWNVTTNMTSQEDVLPDADEQDPCAPELESAISRVIDQDIASIYVGTSQNADPEVTLELGKRLAISGLKYTVNASDAITDYEIQISEDGQTWNTVAEGSFPAGMQSVVYFVNENKDPWICTYDASYVKLIAKGQAGRRIAISEIDLLGPSGDNVEFRTDDAGQAAYGILKEAYAYDNEGGYIPAGSLVFIGAYKGNPAYNVVLLYDDKGNIVGGVNEEGALKAQQIILADVPAEGELGETSDGTFIYWIEPEGEDKVSSWPEKVRAELYRVDNALNNEGQRLVSDSKYIELPEELPEIVIGSGSSAP